MLFAQFRFQCNKRNSCETCKMVCANHWKMGVRLVYGPNSMKNYKTFVINGKCVREISFTKFDEIR